MYAAVREELPARGYPMYEISNYAPPGHEARHNLAYWRGESYLGLGAGAHSHAQGARATFSGMRFLAPQAPLGMTDKDARGIEGQATGGRRWWNERNPAQYIALATRDGIAEAGSEAIDDRTAAGEFVFVNLRLREGFALAGFNARFGREFDDVFGVRAARLFESELLLREGGRIFLSDRGLELADSVFAEFV